MLRISRPLLAGFVLIGSLLAVAEPASAQPPGAPPAKPQPVTTTGCTPTTGDGYQLCSSGKGMVQPLQAPDGTSFSRLSLTYTYELRHNGTVAFRGEEQHGDFDLTKSAGPPTNQLVRKGAALVTPDVTCTFDDSFVTSGNAVRRDLSALACAPQAPASGAAAPAGGGATAAAKPAPAPAPAALPTYSDYSAVDTAPNGLATPIRYGTVGQGNPKTDDCTVTTTTNPQTAVNGAAAGAVICVKPGDYSSSTLTIGKAVTVRANGVVKIRNVAITGSNVTLDGFNVVGGTTLGSPSNYAIKFSGTGHKIINNLVRGRGIYYAIGCDQSAGCGTDVLIAGNSITGVHNFGIYLWGGDRITVEKNNVFDLYQSTDVDDVDALRAWGTNHVVRNNYFHDINGKKSAGSPHSDCYQTYQAGSGPRLSSAILFENNYCVRVTGQCFIAQNDQRNSAELHDFTLRGNVCETGGWQSIEFDGIPNITMDNDYVAGVQVTVLNFANPGAGGLLSSNYKVRNSVLVRGLDGTRYIDGTPADNTANRTFVDGNILTTYNTFVGGTTASYPPVTATDFNKFYRDSITTHASPAVTNAGQPPNSTGLTTDVDGAARVQGIAIDVGPFELG